MGKEHERHAAESELVEGDKTEKRVAHVHHARVAEHEVEAFLREGNEADVEDVAEEEDEDEVGELLDFLGENGNGDTEESVESEFFQHAGVEHGGGRGGGRVGLGRPGVEGEEGDEDAETEKDEEIDDGSGGENAGVAELLEEADVEGAQSFGHGEPESDQSEQEDEAAEGEIDGDFPGDALAFARTPDADEEEGRDEGEFVEGVEEEEVDRGEGADGSGRNEKQARVEHAGGFFDLRCDPDSGEGDERGEEEQHHAQSVGPEREADAVGGEEGVLADELESADLKIVGREEIKAEEKVRARAEEGDAARHGSRHAERGGDQRDEDEGKQRAHQRKTRK